MNTDPYWFHKKWGLNDKSLAERIVVLENIAAELQEKYQGALLDIKRLEEENIETSNCLYEIMNSLDAISLRIDTIENKNIS